LEQKLREDLKSAMIAKDEIKVSTLRLLLSELTYAKVSKGEDSLSDTDIISVVQKEAKKRKESIESFKKAGRDDLSAKEEAELKVLEGYLPAQLSDEELTKIVEEVINNMGASTPADMGKVIGAVMGRVGQQAEGSRVSTIVRSKLV
jgi:uncharacterized protein